MKFILVNALLVSASAFVSLHSPLQLQLPRFASISSLQETNEGAVDAITTGITTPLPVIDRHVFFQQATTIAVSLSTLLVSTVQPQAAVARGRATFEVAYRKFTPRIVAGGEFYSTDMKKLVASADFSGVANALREPPSRSKEDLTKADSGVAARAKQAGQFSDARVLVAADLFAASFSESSISPKTKKMQAAVVKLRNVIQEMETVAREASGETSSGGLFGIGAKKLDKAEAAKKIRALYVEGGNAYNEYVLVANDNLALQFDKLAYIK